MKNTDPNVRTFTNFLAATRHCDNVGLPHTRIAKVTRLRADMDVAIQVYEIRLGTPTRQSTRHNVSASADTVPASF